MDWSSKAAKQTFVVFPSELVLMKKKVLRSNEYAVIEGILIEHGIVNQERHETQTAQPSVTDVKQRHAQYQLLH